MADEADRRSDDELAQTVLSDGLAATHISGSNPPSDVTTERPEKLGRYRVVDKLGEGGMGTVWLAHDDDLDRPLAIKLVRGDGDPRRLLREARSMARLSHPNIATVHDVGVHGDGIYVAMEYIDGPTLREWLTRRPAWPELLSVLAQAGRGLAAAHEAGVIHRDFKPDNVMVARDGRVRVLDFGLAKLAHSAHPDLDLSTSERGGLIGTPRYMAPEQLRGKPVAASSDQFAYCVTVYEAAYGHRPYEGEVLAELAASVLAGGPRIPAPHPGVPGGLWPLLQVGLASEPEARHPSMAVLVAQLERLQLGLQPVVSRPDLRDAKASAHDELANAYAHDLLSQDSLDDRLEQLEHAQSPQTVDGLVADLRPSVPVAQPALPPGPAMVPMAVPVPVAAPAGPPVPVQSPRVDQQLPVLYTEPESILAFFGEQTRTGLDAAQPVNDVITLLGSTKFDLREMDLRGRQIVIRVEVVLGSVEIIVPPGVRVEMKVAAYLAGAEHKKGPSIPPPDAPVLRVEGTAILAGVEVHERLPGETKRDARRRRRHERRALRRR